MNYKKRDDHPKCGSKSTSGNPILTSPSFSSVNMKMCHFIYSKATTYNNQPVSILSLRNQWAGCKPTFPFVFSRNLYSMKISSICTVFLARVYSVICNIKCIVPKYMEYQGFLVTIPRINFSI